MITPADGLNLGYRAGGSLMASLKHLLCCSLILATEAFFARDRSLAIKLPMLSLGQLGSISGRVTLGGSPAEEFRWSLYLDKQLIGGTLPRELSRTVKAAIASQNCAGSISDMGSHSRSNR
jgi:hypothetical protein